MARMRGVISEFPSLDTAPPLSLPRKTGEGSERQRRERVGVKPLLPDATVKPRQLAHESVETRVRGKQFAQRQQQESRRRRRPQKQRQVREIAALREGADEGGHQLFV